MREYALLMNMINYAGIYLKKTNRALIMNTVKHLRWSVLQKGGVGELGGWGGGLVVKLGPFNFLPSSAHESVAEFPSISLNIRKYPWKPSNKQFWLCQDSKYAWSFYMFDRILKMPQVLKNQGSEYGIVVYARVT